MHADGCPRAKLEGNYELRGCRDIYGVITLHYLASKVPRMNDTAFSLDRGRKIICRKLAWRRPQLRVRGSTAQQLHEAMYDVS